MSSNDGSHPNQKCAPTRNLSSTRWWARYVEKIHLRHRHIQQQLNAIADVFEAERLSIGKFGRYKTSTAAGFPPGVQVILERIRLAIRRAAPEARETISDNMPAFTQNGILVYFAAFKKHIGFYPPLRGEAKLEKAISIYPGEKGNLRFPLDQPILYGAIGENR